MNKSNALIGFSGFVGQSLLNQTSFDHLYRTANADAVGGSNFNLVVCCAAPGQKWLANQDPEEDLRNIETLMGTLSKIRCQKLVLISTLDVFSNPKCVDETSKVLEEGLHAYGLHRFWLEEFVKNSFESSHIIRLPGLVGPGLKKNVLFDLFNLNNLERINPNDQFQFYPMVNLWNDIQNVLKHNLNLVHLTAQPLTVNEILDSIQGREVGETLNRPPVKYDTRSIHAELLGNQKDYTYRKSESLIAIRAYFQSEGRNNKGVQA
jgi:hypothetical protein